MISELVSNRYGKDIFKIKLPHHLTDQTFFDVLCEMKNKYDILCLGVENTEGKNLTTNPECDYRMKQDDQLIVIADQRPNIK
jgi:voltage-gated potassium channel